MVLETGHRVGPYEVVAPVGAGGMGEVYRARDTRLHREIALKVLPEAAGADEIARERLVREARTASKLNHPHICTIHDVGEDDGCIYFAMELVSGRTLTDLINQGNSESLPFEIIKVIIAPNERDELHNRIERRFYDMVKSGFVEEVNTLHARGDLGLDLPSIRCVGYRQLWQYLDGIYDYDEAVNRGIYATRQLAKRQLTWLRSEKGGKWVDGTDKNIMNKLLNTVMNVTI